MSWQASKLLIYLHQTAPFTGTVVPMRLCLWALPHCPCPFPSPFLPHHSNCENLPRGLLGKEDIVTQLWSLVAPVLGKGRHD